ncbi:ParB/RepB/Spo0J family partition protein [Ancylobacter aquaticus]|nr:ParB/RepB/Spo0J family partition protein [Ancylobacter aquaticus]
MTDTATDLHTIPLNKLVPSPANVRRFRSEGGITELAASLHAHGQLQNLVVSKGAKGKFEVVAGARRLAAFALLAKEGKITKDHGVMCQFRTEANNAELSLAENIVRERMSEVDEIAAFRTLSEGGLPPEEIAARFGISHMTVRRRLKLAHLSPRILAAMGEGEITLEQAEALALSDDHAEQEAAWFDATGYYSRDPRTIRETLSREHVKGDHRFARCIGLEAYEQAGGAVSRDLFSEASDVYLTDRPLLTRMVMEKLNEEAEVLAAEGWGWAEPDLEGNLHYAAGYHRIYPSRREPTPEQKAEIEALQAEADALTETLNADEGSEAELEAASERYDIVRERLDALDDALSGYDAALIGKAGCVVSVGRDGSMQISRGLVRADDWKAVEAIRNGATPEEADALADDIEDAADGAPALSSVLVEELTAQRTAALRITLAGRPDIALAASLHPLLIRAFYKNSMGYASFESAVELRGEQKDLTPSIQNPAACAALTGWNDLIERTNLSLPGDVAELWEWLIEHTLPTLLSLLAVVTSINLNAVQMRHEKRRPVRLARADDIARAVNFDITRHFKADQAFLERLSKKQLADILTSQDVPADRIASMQKLPKHEAVIRTLAEMRADYVPACIETPAFPDAAEDIEDTDDMGDDDMGEDVALAAE